MKKFFKKSIFLILFSAVVATSLFWGVNLKNTQKTSASEPEPNSSSVSIFIRKPTYSVFHNEKFYFLDAEDGLLKVYNTKAEVSAFESGFIDLSAFEVLSASFAGDCWYLLVSETEQNKVLKINLTEFQIVENFDVTVEKDYISLFAEDVTFSESNYTVLTFSSVNKTPKVVLLDSENSAIQSFALQFDSTSVMSGLLSTVTYQGADGKLFFVFVYRNQIAHCMVSSLEALTDLSSKAIQSITNTPIPNGNMSDPHILNVGFINLASKSFLAICYSNAGAETIRLYSFDFEALTDSLTYVNSDYPCMNAKYLIFNSDYYSYVNDESQQLHFNKVYLGDEDQVFLQTNPAIDNPNYEIEYLSAENFVYKKTNTNTRLYEEPWGSNPIKFDTNDDIIAKNTNVIKIGTAKISSSATEISDYDYCMFTYKNYNFCGFIKSSSLDIKEEISPKQAGFGSLSSIWPRTILYSLPTTVTVGKIGKDDCTLSSTRLMVIEDNSEVEVIDVLCNYVVDGTQMIYVKVNGSYLGFIDANCIRKPSTVNEFVITNATIKNNDTVVYRSASHDSSTYSFKLNKGKNIRINGARDTKTGFTSITFNDEYGNEFSGYIETDYIQADSWSTLQIIGCVLIAINIGLLILILIYKKNHLGSRGQKINGK